MQDIISLDENEYFYLNEHFDIMSSEDVNEMPLYIVNTRKSKFRKLIGIAIENELDGIQREVICDRYYSGLNITEIARKHSFSRQNVYRILDSAHKKLYSQLKYAYFCGFSLINPPENFEEMIKKTDFKE